MPASTSPMTTPRKTKAVRMRTISGLGFQPLASSGLLVVIRPLSRPSHLRVAPRIGEPARHSRPTPPRGRRRRSRATGLRPRASPRTRPVLGRERIDGQVVHTQVLACLEHSLDRTHALAVAEAGGPAAAAGPAAVAVHDDPDVARDLGVQG